MAFRAGSRSETCAREYLGARRFGCPGLALGVYFTALVAVQPPYLPRSRLVFQHLFHDDMKSAFRKGGPIKELFDGRCQRCGIDDKSHLGIEQLRTLVYLVYIESADEHMLMVDNHRLCMETDAR
jgi:hypothetical protein